MQWRRRKGRCAGWLILMADHPSAMSHRHGMRDVGRKRRLTVGTLCQSDSQWPFSRLTDRQWPGIDFRRNVDTHMIGYSAVISRPSTLSVLIQYCSRESFIPSPIMKINICNLPHFSIVTYNPRIFIYWYGHHTPLSFYLYTERTCINADSTHNDGGLQVSINMPWAIVPTLRYIGMWISYDW